MALDKQAFYSQYAQVAIEQQKRYGIPASITLAQMGLESPCAISRLAFVCRKLCTFKSSGKLLAFKISLNL